ncbi:MAG: DinB family protein [Niabella sp.]|nr:DinB family protein [Niabella sp.]
MYTLAIINSIRKKAIRLIHETSLEDLNKIPAGFNNSMAWNFGHLVVSGYSLVFKATGVDTGFVIPLQEKYRKGTKPSEPTTQEELEELIRLSDSFTQAVADALDENKFKTITPYTTETFGVLIGTIDEMLTTVAAHDTSHFQIIKDYTRILA